MCLIAHKYYIHIQMHLQKHITHTHTHTHTQIYNASPHITYVHFLIGTCAKKSALMLENSYRKLPKIRWKPHSSLNEHQVR